MNSSDITRERNARALLPASSDSFPAWGAALSLRRHVFPVTRAASRPVTPPPFYSPTRGLHSCVRKQGPQLFHLPSFKERIRLCQFYRYWGHFPGHITRSHYQRPPVFSFQCDIPPRCCASRLPQRNSRVIRLVKPKMGRSVSGLCP